MNHAGTRSVRGGLMDSLKRKLVDLSRAKREEILFEGPLPHSKIFAAPAWGRVLKSEKILRRLIPVLILALLIMVAASRTVGMMNSSQTIKQAAETKIALVSELSGLYLSANPSLETALSSPTLAEVFLNDALPKTFSSTNHLAFLLNANGKVVAQNPRNPEFSGVQLEELTGGSVLNDNARTNVGVQSFNFQGQNPAWGAFRSVQNLDGKIIGSLLVLQSEEKIFSIWNSSMVVDIVMFLALSTVMLVILYAYFSQGARARDADELFMETNARFDTALARGHCGLWDWDLSRGRIVWSRSMFDMLGMEPSSRVLGFGELSGLLHGDDADLMTLANSAFSSESKQIDHSFRIMHSNGTWVWLRIRAELVRYKGTDPHLIGIAVDITEQEAIKQQSHAADIRLRDAIENISEAFVLWDSKKRLVMCNSKYQQLYNLPASAVVPKTPYDVVMEQSKKPKIKTQVSFDSGFENGSKTFEAQVENGNWLQINERRTQDGGFVSVGTDITQIKRNESKLVESERKHMTTIADLRKSQRQLEYQAQQLVELADDLSEQKDKAEAGNRSKSEFLANISHELRTPLNAIIGFSDIMRSQMFGSLGSEKYDEYAEDIHDSGNFLLGVINDVLDMSKIEAGRFDLNLEEVPIHTLLDETLRIIHMQAEKGELSVSQKIPEDLMIEADRRAVKQILLNLLSNAVKFTQKGGKIEVTAKKSKQFVSIVIADNGIGISEDALKRLGQPFEQVQDQFTKDHKGSGLGLAIARSLSILHGGSLDIRSTEGVGTTVAVRLPIECKVEAPAPEDEDIAA